LVAGKLTAADAAVGTQVESAVAASSIAPGATRANAVILPPKRGALERER
jgi:hypothetical protein